MRSDLDEHLRGRGDDAVDLLGRDDKRGQISNDRRPGAQRDHTLVLQSFDRRTGILLEIDAHDETEAARLTHLVARDPAQPGHELRTSLPSRVRETQAAHLADRGDRRGACERVAAERRRMRTLWEVADRARECDRTHRHSTGDGLREAEQVRYDAVLLERKHRAGPAEAGLHLVDDEEGAAL